MSQRPLPEFDVDSPENWPAYKESLLNYLIAEDIKSQERKLANLKYLGGQKICDLLRLLPPVEIDMNCTVSLLKDKEFSKAIKQLDEYFESKTNPGYFILKFKGMKQKGSETSREFSLRLKNIAGKCDFTDIKEQIRNQLMYGTSDLRLKKLLARKRHVDMEDILEEAQLEESMNMLNKVEGEENEVKFVRSRARPQNFRGKDTFRGRCNICQQYGHMRYQCRLKIKGACHTCGRTGHFSRECYQNKPGTQNASRNREYIRKIDESEDEGTNYIFFLDNGNKIECLVGGVKLELIVDSGSKHNILTLKDWEYLKQKGGLVKNSKRGSSKVFRGYGEENQLTVIGSFEANIQAGMNSALDTFYVIKEGKVSLLGDKTAKDMKLLDIKNENVRYEF